MTENEGISAAKNKEHIKKGNFCHSLGGLRAGGSRGHAGINFIRVDKSAGATQSLDRSQFRRQLKCLALKIIMLRIKKGLMFESCLSNATNHYTCQDLWTDVFMLTLDH